MDLERFRRYTDWHDHVNHDLYEAPADPWKLLPVDPTGIDHCALGVGLYGLGRVEGGDWDEKPRRLANLPFHEGLVQRFEEGRDWEETRLVEWARERFEAGERPRYYENFDSFVERRCAYVDDLYDRIAEAGYRPNVEAGHDNPAAEDNPYEDAYAHHLEPVVAIDRAGEILLAEGVHRLSIAAIQGIDEIPVQVVCRHRDWQAVRDEAATEHDGSHPDYPDHPDLDDLPDGPQRVARV